MDTRYPVAISHVADPQGPAPADTSLGPANPMTFGTRRDFCLTACQALSLGAIAATATRTIRTAGRRCRASRPSTPPSSTARRR